MVQNIFLGIFAFCATSAFAGQKTSEYYSLEKDKCITLVDPGNTDGMFGVWGCAGARELGMKLTASDGRESLELLDVAGNAFADLHVQEITGGAFNSIGKTVEWRGCEQVIGGKTFLDPRVVIYRTFVYSPENDQSNLLVVYSISERKTLGVVESHKVEHANQVARQLADASFSCR